ncbi:MAG: hypothetical protein FWH07_05885 [Oscillospiraceae bacterium]|nr:hypothetical protein [Oscillospiraceae bacterium]
MLGGDNAGRWNTEIFSLVQLISVEPMPPLTSNGYSFYDVFLRVENYGNGDSYWLWRSVDIPDANRID